jgi:hypothetical protein
MLLAWPLAIKLEQAISLCSAGVLVTVILNL